PLPAGVDRALLESARVRGAVAQGRLRGRQRTGALPLGRRLTGGGAMKLVVAVGGASGSIYAKRLLDVLAKTPGEREVALCFSKSGLEVWKHEIGGDPAYPFKRWALDDFRAPFASGSAGWEAMVVIPCSTGGLARIAHGISDDLIGRAADLML